LFLLALLADKIGMCLTIPKKVISIKNGLFKVQKSDGTCEELKSIVDLNIGDFVLSQRGIIIEKISKSRAEEILNLFQKGGENE
jgi:hydrogenase maturation factor